MLPNIADEYTKERAKDEMPQSGTGKTVMTTEPKFVPGEAVEVTFNNNIKAKLRLIDCVGYMIPGAIGNMEGEIPRLVSTPWNDEPIPFAEAAEIGTRKVINDHSTIGVLVTTDGSITDINRDNYIMAEERVVRELKEINKPFVIILNTTHPNNENTVALSVQLKEKYDAPVLVVDCMNLKTEDIEEVLENVLYEFPIKEINVNLPKWFDGLSYDYSLKRDLINILRDDFKDYYKLSDFNAENIFSEENDYVEDYYVKDIELGTGKINLAIDLDNSYYYKIISELSGEEITGEHQILKLIGDLSRTRKNYSRVKRRQIIYGPGKLLLIIHIPYQNNLAIHRDLSINQPFQAFKDIHVPIVPHHVFSQLRVRSVNRHLYGAYSIFNNPFKFIIR